MYCSSPPQPQPDLDRPGTENKTIEDNQDINCHQASFQAHLHPMTAGHQAIWLDQCAHADSPLYNMGGGAFIEGPLDRALLWRALDLVIQESDALRMVPQGGKSFLLLDKITPDIEEIDLSKAQDPEAATLALWEQHSAQPFDLTLKTPPWKIILTRLSEERHGIQALYHHLLMDGFGSTQIMHLWSNIYTALTHGQDTPSSTTPSYCNYLADSQTYYNSLQFEKDKAFWQEHLPELPEPIILPRQNIAIQAVSAKATRTHKDSFTPSQLQQRGNTSEKLNPSVIRQHTIPRKLYDRIEEGVSSPAPVFLAALALYFSKVSGQKQVVIGVPTLNRWGKRYKFTPGLFTNVIPVPINVDPDASLTDLVSAVSRNLRACYRHQRFPLSEITRQLKALKEGRTAIFDLAFSFERQMLGISFGQATLNSTRQLFSGVSRYPIILSLCEFSADDNVEMVLEGDQNYLFDGEAELLLKRWFQILQTIVDAPDTFCRDIELVPETEKQQLRKLTALTALTPPADTLLVSGKMPLASLASPQQKYDTVIHAFLDQAKNKPNTIALISDESRVNYAELELWSRQIALQLRKMATQPIEPDSIIAFAVKRSPAMIAAILGILRSGAAFMPLDPDTPADRLQHMLAEANISTVIVDGNSTQQLTDLEISTSVNFFELNSPDRKKEQALNSTLSLDLPCANQLAYLLYTSGSSGLPKGVMIDHSALMSRIVSTYGSVPYDRSCQGTQITFDPAMVEIFAPLCQGGAIILPPPGRQTMEVIAQTILRHKASFAIFVPSTLPHFLDAIEGKKDLPLRLVWCGGEILSPSLAQRFLMLTGARLINCYGPTEATVLASSWECTSQKMPAVLPIGKAIKDSSIYILDAYGQQLPLGITGEIYLGGPGLARGYRNRPELDTERFIYAPFDSELRLYKTGDRGMMMPDGVVYFSGRADRQVKIRGHRVEPDEIETVLLAHPDITNAAVKAQPDNNSQSLHAWLASQSLDETAVRDYLHSKLPDYMVPGFIKVMDALPNNSSGKVDWQALPEITCSTEPHQYQPPSTPLEIELVTLWEDLLKRSPIGIHDNFFALGGDSLSAMSFLSGLDTLSGKETTVSLSFFIHHPTVAEIAQAFSKFVGDKPVAVTLSDNPMTPTVFIAASGHGDAARFQRLADALGKQCSLVMLQPPLTTSNDPLEQRNLNLAQHYADAIEAKADREFILGGFSIGGIVALETAKELIRRNRAPQRTLLLETVYPCPILNSARIWLAFVKLVKGLNILNINVNGRRLGTMLSDQGLTSQIEAMKIYRASSFDGPVDLIISNGLNLLSPLLFRRWKSQVSKPPRIMHVKGCHGSMFSANNVADLAKAIEKSLHK